MSTTHATKFYVQAQLPNEGTTWASFDKVLATYGEATAHVEYLMSKRPEIHAFRITRETTITSFMAYQPLTNPAK